MHSASLIEKELGVVDAIALVAGAEREAVTAVGSDPLWKVSVECHASPLDLAKPVARGAPRAFLLEEVD